MVRSDLIARFKFDAYAGVTPFVARSPAAIYDKIIRSDIVRALVPFGHIHFLFRPSFPPIFIV
jgi:hypothetical protein